MKIFLFYLFLINFLFVTYEQNALASTIDYDVLTYYKSPNWYIGYHEEYGQNLTLSSKCSDLYKGKVIQSKRISIRFQVHLFLGKCRSGNAVTFAKGVEHYIYVGAGASEVGWGLDQKESDNLYNKLVSDCRTKYKGEISNTYQYKKSGFWGDWIWAGKCTTTSE
ncbi:MAG: hypothetical protein QE271_12565 [Bacteriovoracaceae bacterium]|nr:hypothetical protein [Bacteriovoracaceae bacterium]